jgi:glycosyltransferase involved in cell wall biosynthesis
MTTSPRVTVVITTYNRAELLPRAVASVLAQTMPDFELLVVDDGSTDDTVAVLARVDDPRLHTLPRAHHGVSDSRNAALAVARAPWVAFLDDDNEWKPGYLEHQLRLADAHPEAGVVYCTGELVGDAGGVWPPRTPSGQVFDDLCTPWGPLVSAVMVRRSLLVELGGFSRALEVFEDRDLLLRLSLSTPFAASPEPLVLRHPHDRPRLVLDEAIQRRSMAALDRRWRLTALRRSGLRGFARWTRHWYVDPEVARMRQHAAVCGRAAAGPAIRRLVWRLPWSAPAIGGALVLWATGSPPGA